MSAEEFQRWKVLELLDPWGQRREDWRFALLASQVAAIAGVKRQDGYAFKAADCLLEFNTEHPEEPEDVDPLDAEEERARRAAEIERQTLRMFGFGATQVAKKKIIQEHDKPKGT